MTCETSRTRIFRTVRRKAFLRPPLSAMMEAIASKYILKSRVRKKLTKNVRQHDPKRSFLVLPRPQIVSRSPGLSEKFVHVEEQIVSMRVDVQKNNSIGSQLRALRNEVVLLQ